MTNDASKSLLDKEIMNVFEEQEEKFSFPITSPKDARDFVKLLNKHGCSYEVISKEVCEDEEVFRDWRLGGGSLEIGKRVLERINRPFRDTMFSESESDDKRNSLKDFYQFSFDDEEVFAAGINLKSPKIEITSPTKGANSSNLPADKSKTNLSANHTSQTNILSAPSEIVTSQHPSSYSKPKNVEPKQIANMNQAPSSKPVEIKKSVDTTFDKQKPRSTSPIAPVRGKQSLQPSKQTHDDTLKLVNSAQESTNSLPKISSPSEKVTSQNETKVATSKPSTSLTTSAVSTTKHLPSSAQSSAAEVLSPSSQTPQTSKSPTSPSQPASSNQTTSIDKPNKETPVEEERPPSPITTSSHYQPFVSNFNVEEIESMLNYNSDDQSEKVKTSDGAGFIYMFSDIPSPTMKINKHTKFRVKVGISRDPKKRLQQALFFNPDMRMLASIPVGSRNSCKLLLRENLKSMTMKNKVDWYWANLNALFAGIDIVLQKSN